MFKKEIYFEQYFRAMEDSSITKGQWIDNRLFFHDILPPSFKNWLEFYDGIPSKYLEAKSVEYIRVYDAAQVMAVFHIVPIHREAQVQVVHSVGRDYLLARVAELLIPARMSFFDLDSLRRRLYLQDSFRLSDQEVSEILRPLAAVARPK